MSLSYDEYVSGVREHLSTKSPDLTHIPSTILWPGLCMPFIRICSRAHFIHISVHSFLWQCQILEKVGKRRENMSQAR